MQKACFQGLLLLVSGSVNIKMVTSREMMGNNLDSSCLFESFHGWRVESIQMHMKA